MNGTNNLQSSLEGYAYRVYDAVSTHYGISKYFWGYPCINVINDDEELLSGEFRDDCCEVMVNIANMLHLDECDAKEEIARTITHEYIHYLQSPAWMKRYYKMGHDYFSHPYEVEAYRRENELLTELLEL